MKKKFYSLRVIATIFKILAFINLGGTILVVILLLGSTIFGGAVIDELGRQYGEDTYFLGLFTGLLSGGMLSVFIFISGLISSLMLYSVGEILYLQIAIEENTRFTASVIQQLRPELVSAEPKLESIPGYIEDAPPAPVQNPM